MSENTWFEHVDFEVDGQPVLQLSDHGAEVNHLQTRLTQAGFPVTPTGNFDEATERAVRDYQRREGLVVDGRVGSKTVSRLRRYSEQTETWSKGSSGTDVRQIQHWLNQAGAGIKVDGDFGPGTERAVRTFQKESHLPITGVVDSVTFEALNTLPPDERLLSQADIEWAANSLDVPVAAVMAVNEVESRGSGFFSDDSPAILYERHVMRRRLVSHEIDPVPFIQRSPNIVNTKTGGYRGGVKEHARLSMAKAIHVPSGLESASWGLFQIMGYHWKVLGYKSVEDFVDKMFESERRQLEAFVRFIKADQRLHTALQELDWSVFARYYNGPNYAKNEYDIRMSNAFDSHQRALAV